MSKSIKFLFALLVLPALTFSQFYYNHKIEQLHGKVLKLNCENKILNNNSLSEKNGLNIWLLAYNDFLSYYFGTAQISNITLNNNLNQYYEKLKHFESDSPYYNFSLAEINLFLAYTNIESESYYTAGRNLIRAYKQIERNIEKYPDFSLNIRHKLIQAAIDYWLVKNIPIFFGEKDKSEGHLREIIKLCVIQNIESNSFLSENNLLALFVSAQILNDNSTTKYLLENFTNEWKESGPLESLACISFMQNNMQKQKKSILYNAQAKGYFNSCNALNLNLGIVLLNELNDSCVNYLNTYKRKQVDQQNILFTNLKLSWYYYLNNIPDSVSILLKENTKLQPVTSNDNQAEYEFLNIAYWDSVLIKARILFDGGFHLKAKDLLQKNKKYLIQLGGNFQVQYAYFLARIYHSMDDYEKALFLYNKVVQSETDKQFYYAAYSAYYAGLINEKNKQLVIAKKYYKICLELSSPIYSESIHRKATSRIDNLKQKQ